MCRNNLLSNIFIFQSEICHLQALLEEAHTKHSSSLTYLKR